MNVALIWKRTKYKAVTENTKTKCDSWLQEVKWKYLRNTTHTVNTQKLNWRQCLMNIWDKHGEYVEVFTHQNKNSKCNDWAVSKVSRRGNRN